MNWNSPEVRDAVKVLLTMVNIGIGVLVALRVFGVV